MREKFKGLLNVLRNILIFQIRYPWVQRGRNIHCQSSTTFWSPHRYIILGNNVGIGDRCTFLCDVEIGNKVLIAADVALVNSDDHRYDVVGQSMWDAGRGDQFKISVEDDVWIGHGAIVLTPVHIGRGSIVAAGASSIRMFRAIPLWQVCLPKWLRCGFFQSKSLNMNRFLFNAVNLTRMIELLLLRSDHFE